MPVLRCPCGKALRVPEELAGKRVRCPACTRALPVPEAAEVLEAMPAAEVPLQAARPVSARRLWWYCSTHRSFLPHAVLVTLAGPLFLVLVLAVRSHDDRYGREGARTDATVTAKTATYKVRGPADYGVSYQYRTPDGQIREGSGEVPQGTWASLKEGDRLPIKYLAGDPGQSQPAIVGDSERQTITSIGLYAALAVAALGPLLLLLSLRGVARRVALLRRGTRTVARITKVFKEHAALHYGYTDEAGQEHLGRTPWIGGRKKPYRTGEALVVVYDPARPSRHEIDVLGVRALS